MEGFVTPSRWTGALGTFLARSSNWISRDSVPSRASALTNIPSNIGSRACGRTLTLLHGWPRPEHPPKTQRGIDPATAAEFGVGFYPGRGVVTRRIVILIYNLHGQLVAYAAD